MKFAKNAGGVGLIFEYQKSIIDQINFEEIYFVSFRSMGLQQMRSFLLLKESV